MNRTAFYLTIILISIFKPAMSAEFIQKFSEWSVTVTINDFDKKAVIKHPLYDRTTNKKLDSEFQLNLALISKSKIYTTVSIYAYPQIDPTFPECQLDFLKFKLDNSEAEFFPNDDGACQTINLDESLVNRFKSGKFIYFPKIAGLQESYLNLDSFDKAWNYAEKILSN